MFHQVFIGGGGWLMGRYSALAGGGDSSDYLHSLCFVFAYLYFLLNLHAGFANKIRQSTTI